LKEMHPKIHFGRTISGTVLRNEPRRHFGETSRFGRRNTGYVPHVRDLFGRTRALAREPVGQHRQPTLGKPGPSSQPVSPQVARGEGMTPIRRIILFIMAALMIAGGGYVIVMQLFYAPFIYLRVVGGAGTLLALGAYLLWEDFIRPLIKRAPSP